MRRERATNEETLSNMQQLHATEITSLCNDLQSKHEAQIMRIEQRHAQELRLLSNAMQKNNEANDQLRENVTLASEEIRALRASHEATIHCFQNNMADLIKQHQNQLEAA